MFVRFVVPQIDRSSGRRRGALHAAYRLRRSGALASYDLDHLSAALTWFDEELDRPARLARSRRPHREAKAICWFKRGAVEHLAWMREIQRILETYGTFVEIIRSARPGYIVYEDEFQIAACPFRETPA